MSRYQPPESRPYYFLWGTKADMDVQRNILLRFIHERNLDEEFVEWFKENYKDLDEDEGENEDDT